MRCVVKGFEIKLLDRLMQENANLAATGQIDVVGARLESVDAGFEFIGLRRLKGRVRFDDQASMLDAQIVEFALGDDGPRCRFKPFSESLLVNYIFGLLRCVS